MYLIYFGMIRLPVKALEPQESHMLTNVNWPLHNKCLTLCRTVAMGPRFFLLLSLNSQNFWFAPKGANPYKSAAWGLKIWS